MSNKTKYASYLFYERRMTATTKKIWKQNIIGLKNEAMRASFINFIEIIMLEKGSEIQWRWMEWAIFCGEWRLRVYRFDGIMDQRDD